MTVVRTSQTHPLQIAEVRASPSHGRIGITFCPGKQDRFAHTGAWERDLGIDLDAIAAWGAKRVLTLVEPAELVELKVPRQRRRPGIGGEDDCAQGRYGRTMESGASGLDLERRGCCGIAAQAPPGLPPPLPDGLPTRRSKERGRHSLHEDEPERSRPARIAFFANPGAAP